MDLLGVELGKELAQANHHGELKSKTDRDLKHDSSTNETLFRHI
jgi:hypothetical protein